LVKRSLFSKVGSKLVLLFLDLLLWCNCKK